MQKGSTVFATGADGPGVAVAVGAADDDVTGETAKSNAIRSVVIMGGYLLWVPPNDKQASCTGSHQV